MIGTHLMHMPRSDRLLKNHLHSGQTLYTTYHFRLYLSNNFNGNKYILYQDLHGPRGGYFFTYERGLVIIDIAMACDISI